MDRYKNKYRIQSHRKPGWDYSANGFYFITLVTQNRECNLGKIVDKKMILSDWGQIVCNEWLKSFEIRHELFLDNYNIMPNHIHAIVVIDVERTDMTVVKPEPVDTHGRAYLQSQQSQQSQPPSPPNFIRLPKSISSFIAGFKSAVNSKIDDDIDANNLNIPKYNRNNHFFQPNYHDHIIRNDSEYHRISNYINNNPNNWTDDKFFSS